MKDKFVLLGIGILIAILAIIFLFKQIEKKKLAKINDSREKIVSVIQNFNNNFVGAKYITNKDSLQIKENFKDDYQFIKSLNIPSKHVLYLDSDLFIHNYENLDTIINNNNETFVFNEKNKYSSLFSNIDGKSLDDQQRDAVVIDEDHNLVVAGAGSGKTLTISGKVKYLCEVKGIKPEDILLISFTKKAAQEMTDRIATKLGYNVQATTFHKLGLDILKQASNKVYDVLDDMRQFLEDYFTKKISEDKNLLRNLIEFFAYYLQIPADIDSYGSLGEAYDHEKSADLETIKSKYTTSSLTEEEKSKRKLEKKTLKDEQVKSLEEIEIANFLFLHGVEYEYEPLYPFQDEESKRRAYHPDFYLKDYDIYLEHFGINEQNACPQLSPIEEEKYLEDMVWKINWHKKNGTKLIQTYSYYQSQGILLDKLEELLLSNSVKFKEVNLEDIFNSVYAKQGKKYFSEFISLCSSFISLFKSNGYVLDDLAHLTYKNEKLKENPFFMRRIEVFKEIISVLIAEYEQHLKDNNAFDFSDMINLSTETINDGFKVHEYKYVIIDEFQDISVARYKLVKAILDQTKAKLLCVGDDWQSIYRFAGSDISLFTNFEDYFGYSKIMRIEKTYRNSQQLIDEAGRFVMKNPKQIKKHLKSDKNTNSPINVWHYTDDPANTLKQMMDSIISEFGAKSSILLLGRTSYDFEIIKDSGLFFGKSINELHYKNSPDTPISFLTVHKAKGLEADNVIILNFENSTLGFPNKIADDPMLELVLSESDDFIYAEERRLFYVAITRTKNKTYILTNGKNPSEFEADLKENSNVSYSGNLVENLAAVCPKCKTGHLIRRTNFQTRKAFIGCSNYPKCDYTNNSVEAVENKRVCPSCGGFLTLRPGKWGAFYGCTNYPRCQYTEEYNEIKYCPECGAELRLRKSQHGLFWGCSNYPNCKHIEKV